MKVVILAGGGGTRLFPVSRSNYPKQFLHLAGEESLLLQTVRRFLLIAAPADLVLMTNTAYYQMIKAELAACQLTDIQVVLEPAVRNTAPAIMLAVRYLLDQVGVSPDEVILVSPADSLINPSHSFVDTVREALRLAAKHKLVTVGVRPTKTETGYGYLKLGAPWESGYIVDQFKEKPDARLAQEYVASGQYLWNSGIFALRIDLLFLELASNAAGLYRYLELPYNELVTSFGELPNISFDYALGEKSRQVVTVPLTCFWSDIGSWDAVFELLPKDGAGNALFGDCVTLGCKDTLLYAKNRLIAGIDLEDILVIETADVVLIAKKGDSQKVKTLVEHLKIHGRSEITEDRRS